MTEPETQRIGDYVVLGVLGSGGMGQVYKVRNVLSDRIEAMKVILPDLAGCQDLADRFLREIKLLAALDHPNIAALRTALTVSNQLVMIMEYVEGTTLEKRLEQGPLPVSDAVNYTSQVLGALSYAHQQGVIHRDIKPANMMLTPEGVVKLMDFGIARSGAASDLTATGATVGSLYYMPPEQVKGQPTDARSDLYSVGASLYEMVTNQRPFRADSNYSLMAAQVQQPPKPPIELRPGLPEALNEIILVAMAKEPNHRFQSADAFRTALKTVETAAPEGAAEAQNAPVPPDMAKTTLLANTSPAKSDAGMAKAEPQPVAQPVPSVMELSSQKRSHRGLYMALGGLAVVAFLVAAGIYLPRREKTRAGGQSSSTEQKPAPEGAASTPTGDASSPPAANPNPTSPATGGDAGTSAQSLPSPGAHDAGNSMAGGQRSTPNPAQDKSAPASDRQVKKASSRVKTPDAEQTPGDTAAMAPPPDNSAALEEVERQVDQMSGRAAAVNDSLDNLRRQQSAQGLGLRGDMAAAQERMKIHLAKAKAALDNQDLTNAKKYSDQAEADLEQLERFLGR
jgi:serine/threonine protein kinase